MMEFTYDLQQLRQCVTAAARGCAKGTALPILTHVLIEAGERVRFTGTDLETSISAGLSITCDRDGAVCVPGRVLVEMLDALPAHAEVTFSLGERMLEISAGPSSRFELHTLPGTEFAQIPAVTGTEVRIAGAEFAALCKRAGYCPADANSGREILQSMLLRSAGAQLAAASTDSHRLAVMRIDADLPDFAAILPEGLVSTLLRILDPKQDITLTVDAQAERPMLSAQQGGITITARLLSGQYPPIERVIPQDAALRCVCDRKALLAALKRLSVVARTATGKVVLSTALGTLTITCTGEAGQAREEIAAYEAVEWQAAYNVQYLQEALEVSTGERITLAQAGELTPLLLSDDDPRWQSVVMPMQAV